MVRKRARRSSGNLSDATSANAGFSNRATPESDYSMHSSSEGAGKWKGYDIAQSKSVYMIASCSIISIKFLLHSLQMFPNLLW